MPKYSREQCIEEMQTIAAGQGGAPTRDTFRDNSIISETDWTFWFGNYSEFKKQAGLDLTRHESRFVEKIARSASTYDVCKKNREKWGWKDSYPKPSLVRYQTFLVVSDIHDIQCDPFYRRMIVEAAKVYKPTKVIYNGDTFDCLEFSSYNKKFGDLKLRERHEWVSNLFLDLRNAAPDAEHNMIEGNHEYRLVSHLTSQSPMIIDLLDLHGWSVPDFFGLNEFEINYYSRSDLGTFTEADIQNELKRNYYQFSEHVLFHHFPQGKMFGMPGCSGHHHAFKVWNCFNATYGAYNWYQTGGGSRRYVDYDIKMGQQWTNGFMLVHIDLQNKKNSVFEYVDCTKDFCMLAGVRYNRKSNERLFQI